MNTKNKSSEKNKIGVYVCHCGGNISDKVRVEQVASMAEKLPNVVIAKHNPFMCSDPGQQEVAKDIQKHGINRVVVSACSPFLHELTFRTLLEREGVNPYLLEQANIREQCSWVHHNKDEATAKAFTLIKMAVAKADKLCPLDSIKVDCKKSVLVVGGGIAGMRAASQCAKLGLEVELIEREDRIGGFLKRLDSLYPDGEKAQNLLANIQRELEAASNVRIHTNAELIETDGTIGQFDTKIKINEGDQEKTINLSSGMVIMATGFSPAQPGKKEYGFGRIPQVISLEDYNSLLAEGSSQDLKFGGKKVNSIGFVHCVGSRQRKGLQAPQANGRINEYCSRVCCTSTLHAISRTKDLYPNIRIHDFHQDIRTYGRFQEDLYEKTSKQGVIFHRFEGDKPPKVKKAQKKSDHNVLISLMDQLTWGEEVLVGVDLLVLSLGMMPNDISSITDEFKLSTSTDGFLQEVHPKLRPVEMATKGILLAGSCQGPKDISESCDQASAAATKAMSTLGKGEVELPPFIAKLDNELCQGHGNCIDACPIDGAIKIQNGKAHINPVLCNGCGCCVAVCPERALDINAWTLEQFESMVDAMLDDSQKAQEECK